ncbi:hypothetical protein [Cysteiniphilum halobium]|uniref:hypothetical protein n=1 Tax=Cysteiniphilum halobium TaxID=2219059 RepID=UPI003F8546D1
MLLLLTSGGFMLIQESIKKTTHIQQLYQIQTNVQSIESAAIAFYRKHNTDANAMNALSVEKLRLEHLLVSKSNLSQYHLSIIKTQHKYVGVQIIYQSNDLAAYSKSEIINYLYPSKCQTQGIYTLVWIFPLVQFDQTQQPYLNFAVGNE